MNDTPIMKHTVEQSGSKRKKAQKCIWQEKSKLRHSILTHFYYSIELPSRPCLTKTTQIQRHF